MDEEKISDPRASLELKKLELEIAEMKRPWWKRPAYILAALPTLLAITALTVGFFNGFFSAQLTKLENQKHDVELQIKEFEGTRSALVSQNEGLQKELLQKEKTVKRVGELISELQSLADALEKIDQGTGGVRPVNSQAKTALQELLHSHLKDISSKMSAIADGEKKTATH